MKTPVFKIEEKKVVWVYGDKSRMATGPTDEPQRNLRFFGHPHMATGFGLANGELDIHAEQFYNDPETGLPVPEKGNAPFFVDLKLNGNPYRTAGPFPACIDPLNLEEFNIQVKDLPRGDYQFTVYDSTPPPEGPLDARSGSAWGIVSPPYGTLNGLITPPDPSATLTVWFEFGLTAEYGRIAQAGTVNGSGTFPVLIQLSAKTDEGSPEEYLEPGKTYHFRVACSDGSTTWHGEDMTFDTPAIPVAVTMPATNITL